MLFWIVGGESKPISLLSILFLLSDDYMDKNWSCFCFFIFFDRHISFQKLKERKKKIFFFRSLSVTNLVVAAAAVGLHLLLDKFGDEFPILNIVVETFFSGIVFFNCLIVKQKILHSRFCFVSVKIGFEILATE